METDKTDTHDVDPDKSEMLLNLNSSETNPWPYLQDHFEFKCKKGNSFIMRCKLCLPKTTELAACKSSTSNLRKHVERKHPLKAEAAVEQVGQRSSDEEDFFSSMKSRWSQGTGELDGYLSFVSNKMDLLN